MRVIRRLLTGTALALLLLALATWHAMHAGLQRLRRLVHRTASVPDIATRAALEAMVEALGRQFRRELGVRQVADRVATSSTTLRSPFSIDTRAASIRAPILNGSRSGPVVRSNHAIASRARERYPVRPASTSAAYIIASRKRA